jgi:hypothetical protein
MRTFRKQKPSASSGSETPQAEEILRARYARGELDRNQFLLMLEDLRTLHPRKKPSELQTLTTIPAQVCEENAQAADCTKLRDRLREGKAASLTVSSEKKTCSGKIWKRKTVIGKLKSNYSRIWSGRRESNPYLKLGKLYIKL